MKKLFLAGLVFSFALSLLPLLAVNDVEAEALRTVKKEISAALAGRSEHASGLGQYTDFNTDLKKVLKRYSQPGMPKTLYFNGKPAKILVPLNLDEKLVGGFFQVSTNGRKILSYLPAFPDFIASFSINPAE